MTRKLGSAILVLSVLWAVTSLALKGGIGLTRANAGPSFVCPLNVTATDLLINQTANTEDLFSLGYYNLGPVGGPVSDNTLTIVNPGTTGGESTCANIYVFDSNQNMLACCSCPVSPNGLLTLSVKNNLLNGSTKVKSGVIEVVSSCSSLFDSTVVPDGPSVCSASAPYYPSPELVGWLSHWYGVSPITEQALKHATLSCNELESLETGCAGVRACSCPAGTL